VLNVTSPRAGDKWDGTHTLSWSTSDPDGGQTTYTVLYTPDGGTSWYPLEIDTRQPQLTISTAQIANGDQVQFRVLATDGLNTTRADSPPIQVRNGMTPAATAPATGGNIAVPTDAESLLYAGVCLGSCGVVGVLALAGVVLLRRRGRRPAPPPPQAAALPGRAPDASWQCRRCGTANRQPGRFCTRCGTPRSA